MSIPSLSDTDFVILGVPQQFDLSEPTLTQNWKDLQSKAHPDRFVSQGQTAQRLATQWSVRINEAYQRLKNPISRAALLCEIAGASINAQTNTAMPATFLMQQMQWRETLEEAQTLNEIDALYKTVKTQYTSALASLTWLIDEQQDFQQASNQVRALMFMEKFIQDIHKKLDTFDA